MQGAEEERRAVAAVLVAAGRSERFGTARPKQFVLLQGRPCFVHALAALAAAAAVQDIVVVVTPGFEVPARQSIEAAGLAGRVTCIVPGGATRQESVWRGLQALHGSQLVLIHDAARPFLTPGLVERVVAAARRSGAATLALPLRDTLMRAGAPAQAASVVERDGVWAVQTPQVFARELLEAAHGEARRAGVEASDDGTLILRLGRPLELVPGSWWNIKLTVPEDLELAQWILRADPRAAPAPAREPAPEAAPEAEGK